MAIGTTPLFNEISGNAGPVNFRTRHNGKIELSKLRVPYSRSGGERSQQQNDQNTAYAEILTEWQNESSATKDEYNQLGTEKKLSGWNYYLKERMENMIVKNIAFKKLVTFGGSWTVEPDNVNKITNGNLDDPTTLARTNVTGPHLAYFDIDLLENLYAFGLAFKLELRSLDPVFAGRFQIHTSYDKVNWHAVHYTTTSSTTLELVASVIDDSNFSDQDLQAIPRYIRLSPYVNVPMNEVEIRVYDITFLGI